MVRNSVAKRKIKRRSKAITVMLLLPLIFLAFIGYLICWLDYSRQNKPKTKRTAQNLQKEDDITFVPAFGEEHQTQTHESRQ